jgi:8-oxo-dGTP diphosphatase
MAKLLVVRHADAGHRSSAAGADEDRPLSARGRRQAEALADELGQRAITRLLASPFARCVQTLQPLGQRLGLPVEPEPRLAEGAPVMDVLRLTQEVADVNAVLCSHGDVIPDLLDALVQRGMRVKDELRWQKASTWVLTWDGHELVKGRYVPPPR